MGMWMINRQHIRFILIILNCSLLHFYQSILFFLVRPFHRPLYKRLVSELIQVPWINILSYFLPSTKKLVLSGDCPMDPKRPCIIIANHQMDADWWYIWQVAKENGNHGSIKVVLKSSLKHIPLVGWVMRMLDFLFIKRDLKVDAKMLSKKMKEFKDDQFPAWILLFPEGTTIHQEYVDKSHAFAKKNGRPTLTRVLLPRSAGMDILLQAARELKPDIYDLTIGYSSYTGEIPSWDMGYTRKIDTDIPSIKTMFCGQSAPAVHVHGVKYAFDSVYVPSSSSSLSSLSSLSSCVPIVNVSRSEAETKEETKEGNASSTNASDTFPPSSNSLEHWLDDCWTQKDARLATFMTEQVLTMNATERSSVRTLFPEVASQQAGMTPILHLWSTLGVAFMFLPVLMFVCLPLYGIWVTYRVTTAVAGWGQYNMQHLCSCALSTGRRVSALGRGSSSSSSRSRTDAKTH